MWSAIPRWMKNQLESLVGFASEIGHIVRVFCLCIGAYNIALETNSEYIVFYLSYWPTENHEISTDLYSVLFTANLIGWYCFFSDLLSIWNKLQPDKKKWKSQKFCKFVVNTKKNGNLPAISHMLTQLRILFTIWPEFLCNLIIFYKRD